MWRIDFRSMFLFLLMAAATFRISDCAVEVKNPDPIAYVKLGDNVTLTWTYTLTGVHFGKFELIGLQRYIAPSGAPETMASSKGIPSAFREKVGFASPGSFTLWNITEDDLKWTYTVVIQFGGPPSENGNDVRLILKVDVSAKIRGDDSLVYEEGMQIVCDVTGVPHPDVGWYKKGFDDDHLLTMKHNVIGSFNYTFNVSADIAGQYICKANNTFNRSYAEVEVLVQNFTSINFISVCDTNLLCCPAYGFPLPVYRWTLPDGQSSTVSEQCLAVDVTETGTYICEAKNPKGQATVKVAYCETGNATEVNDTKKHKGEVPLKWQKNLKEKSYTVIGTDVDGNKLVYLGCGIPNEAVVYWRNLDLPNDKKAANLKFEVIGHTTYSSQIIRRIFVFMESSVARSLQDRCLGMAALLVFGLVYFAL